MQAIRPMNSLIRTINRVALYRGVLLNNAPIMSSSALPANMPLVVGHDEKGKTFYLQIEDSQKQGAVLQEKAVLDYECVSPGVFNLYHTEVPSAYRGQGVAKLLAKAAMDYVVEKDAKMYLTCTYLEKYLRDNPLPQYTSRVLDKSNL